MTMVFILREEGEDHVVAAFYHILFYDLWEDHRLCIQNRMEDHKGNVWSGVPAAYPCGSCFQGTCSYSIAGTVGGGAFKPHE